MNPLDFLESCSKNNNFELMREIIKNAMKYS